jgi:hypothetical protein
MLKTTIFLLKVTLFTEPRIAAEKFMLKGQMLMLLMMMVIASEPAEQIGGGGCWHATAEKSAGMIIVHGLRLDQRGAHHLFLFLLRLFLIIALHVHLVILLFSLGVSGGGGGLSAVTAAAAATSAAAAAGFGPLVLHPAILKPDFHLKLCQV